MEDNRKKALSAALGQIERQFGKGAVMKMGDQPREAIPAVSTGSLGLDVALGIGGLPYGRICEIYGPESSGKTTLTLQVIAEAQKAGKTCAFVDAEHALENARTFLREVAGVQQPLLTAQKEILAKIDAELRASLSDVDPFWIRWSQFREHQGSKA